MPEMQWRKLLNETRARDLFGDAKSRRVEVDERTEFERDYGRVLFSGPVRRLQDKAQVFPLEPNDAVRTRLTHSLEVASVAKSLADVIGRRLVRQSVITHFQASDISTIATTCGLVHDLGNPPFGHAGEVAIVDWFRCRCARDEGFKQRFEQMGHGSPRGEQYRGDFLNFDGNPQTLRLLTQLQFLTDRYGLNLTCGTISAACKYVPPSHQLDKAKHTHSKVGFYASEEELIRRVRERTETFDRRNPITFIVEAADDIVYAVVDIEDGVKKGVVSWDDCLAFFRKNADGDELFADSLARTERLVNASALPVADRNEAMSQVFRTYAIGNIVPHVAETFIANYDRIMNGEFFDDLIGASSAHHFTETCKNLGRTLVFPSDGILKLEVMGRQIIHDLLDHFWDAAEDFKLDGKPKGHHRKVYQIASPNYRNVFEVDLRDAIEGKQGHLPDAYVRAHLATDYVCGMTDTFAQSLHRDLFNG